MICRTRLVRQTEGRRRIRRVVVGRKVLRTKIEVSERLAGVLEAFVEEFGCSAGGGCVAEVEGIMTWVGGRVVVLLLG